MQRFKRELFGCQRDLVSFISETTHENVCQNIIRDFFRRGYGDLPPHTSHITTGCIWSDTIVTEILSALPESPIIPSGRKTAKITSDPQRVGRTKPVVVSGAPFPPIIAGKGDRVAAD